MQERHPELHNSLCRLARFGANISDAHSCCILLPRINNTGKTIKSLSTDTLVITGYHSLSSDIDQNSTLQIGNGLIGWVALHGKAIHVSPFEQDCRTLGIYEKNCDIKSLIGIPIDLSHIGINTETNKVFGVILCDSKKLYAFSKLQGKLLQDLAFEISHNLKIQLQNNTQASQNSSWNSFLDKSAELIQALGRDSVCMLRLSLLNYYDLEQHYGAGSLIDVLDQSFRLIQQALPPHYALTQLPNGDIIICLDNMMIDFYRNKIKQLIKHVCNQDRQPEYDHSYKNLSVRDCGQMSLEEIISSLSEDLARNLKRVESDYELNRA